MLRTIAPGVIVTPMGGHDIATPEGRKAMAKLVTGRLIAIAGGADAVTRGDDVWPGPARKPGS